MALIGTTDIPYEGRAEDVAIDDREIDYVLGCRETVSQEWGSRRTRDHPQLSGVSSAL